MLKNNFIGIDNFFFLHNVKIILIIDILTLQSKRNIDSYFLGIHTLIAVKVILTIDLATLESKRNVDNYFLGIHTVNAVKVVLQS